MGARGQTGQAQPLDLLVIGGGINGAGIALDAVGRGLSVLLCEKGDLASATSSASSKLIHGGLRYLENYEFRLVREALAEREVLMRAAPHLIGPLRFRLPQGPAGGPGSRPAWMIRAGLFLYDHLARRNTLPSSGAARWGAGSPLREEFARGFEYSDCNLDDSRLVVLVARAAAERGAAIRTRLECTALVPEAGGWRAELTDRAGRVETVRARAVANAAGPWVRRLLDRVQGVEVRHQIRMVKGSHIVVPRITEADEAYLLQNEDGRIVFVLPTPEEVSLIGTTDIEFTGDPGRIAAAAAEEHYLLDVVNRYFKRQLVRADIRLAYAGVRPLLDDGSGSAQQVTRDYVLELDRVGEDAHGGDGGSPILSVFGGKLTTYRRLAEHALDKLAPLFGHARGAWTETLILPGGDFRTRAELAADFAARWPFLDRRTVERFVRGYGTLTHEFMSGANSLSDMGEPLGYGFSERELDYLRRREWAQKAWDVLWRRTKLGFVLTDAERARVKQLCQAPAAA